MRALEYAVSEEGGKQLELVVELGALEAWREACARHMPQGLQDQAARAIGNVAIREGATHYLVEAGCVDALIELLAHLCGTGPDEAEDAGGVDPSDSSAASVLTSVLHALSNLAEERQTLQRLSSHGLAALLAASRGSDDSAFLQAPRT